MTIAPLGRVVVAGYCEDCDSPKGGYICRACASDRRGIDMRAVLEWRKPWLTRAEVELLERFIDDVEEKAGTP